MSWKDGYNRAVTAFIVANGSPVRERNWDTHDLCFSDGCP